MPRGLPAADRFHRGRRRADRAVAAAADRRGRCRARLPRLLRRGGAGPGPDRRHRHRRAAGAHQRDDRAGSLSARDAFLGVRHRPRRRDPRRHPPGAAAADRRGRRACCSSPAPTSPTCCWSAATRGMREMAVRSAVGASAGSPGPPAAHRERRAGDRRRGPGTGRGGARAARAGGARSDQPAAAHAAGGRLDRGRLHPRRRGDHDAALRAGAGAAHLARQPGRVAARGIAAGHRRGRPPAPARRAGGRGSGAGRRPGDRRRPDGPQPRGAGPRAARLRSRRRADDAGGAAPDPLRHARRRSSISTASWSSACARCRASKRPGWCGRCRWPRRSAIGDST